MVPTSSTCPCTRCPELRPSAASALSRFSAAPGAAACSAGRDRLRFEPSLGKERQAPVLRVWPASAEDTGASRLQVCPAERLGCQANAERVRVKLGDGEADAVDRDAAAEVGTLEHRRRPHLELDALADASVPERKVVALLEPPDLANLFDNAREDADGRRAGSPRGWQARSRAGARRPVARQHECQVGDGGDREWHWAGGVRSASRPGVLSRCVCRGRGGRRAGDRFFFESAFVVNF